MAIRAERTKLNGLVERTVAGGAEMLSEIAATAVATVFNIHRVLRSTERFSDAVADLLDVFHHVLRLFALCKVSGDVAKEVNTVLQMTFLFPEGGGGGRKGNDRRRLRFSKTHRQNVQFRRTLQKRAH